MLITLTREQMLAMWRLKRYHEPLNDPSTVTVDEEYGIDSDRLHATEMREWYLHQLDTAHLSLLPVSDYSHEVALRHQSDGSATVELPPECRRIVSVALTGWSREAVIVDADSPMSQLQRSPYSRGGQESPVAVVNGREIRLYSPTPGATVSQLTCVAEPRDGSYTLDDSLLNTIKPYGTQ